MSEQMTADDLAELHRRGDIDAIEQARIDGKLDNLLGIVRHQVRDEQQWTLADIQKMAAEGRHEDIEQARQAGLLNNALGANN